MATGLDSQRLDMVFGSRPDILGGIRNAADTPSRITLFNEIASFVHQKLATEEPASKRRRLGPGAADSNADTPVAAAKEEPLSRTLTLNAADVASEPVLLEIREISVSVPQRKKYNLCFTANHLYARVAGATAPAQGIVYAWRDIAHIFFLPVPEKAQAQHNYVVIPKGSCLPASKTAAPADEPLVFTISATPPKAGTITGPEAQEASAVSDNYQSLFHWAINTHLRAARSRTTIVASDPNVFHSASRQNVRPGEKPVHVRAFRGSKDGYLFLLPTGILWAFKKPLLFVPLDRITAVSYTSILQRTFNVVIEAILTPGAGEAATATEELEFAMVDQEDYNGIDQNYVRRHRLQDRSMAEQRKAKLELAENAKLGKKGEDDDADGDAEADGKTKAGGEFEGLTALQIAEIEAERKLQDEEDEEEEDYEPSGDESEGSGSSSEEDSDGEEDDEGEEEVEVDGQMDEDEAVEQMEVVREPVKKPAKKEPVNKPVDKPDDKPVKKEPVKREPVNMGPVKKEQVKKEPVKKPIEREPVEEEPEDAVMADVPTTMELGTYGADDDEDEHLDIGL